MASLSNGAEGLIASLGRAQAELEWVQARLEEEFALRNKDGREANPYGILMRINKLRRCGAEMYWGNQSVNSVLFQSSPPDLADAPYIVPCRDLPAVQAECRQVLAARQAVVDAAKQRLVGNTELLASLQRRAGLAPDPAAQETLAAFGAAVREHERTTSALAMGTEAAIDRDQLNEAFVSSALGQV